MTSEAKYWPDRVPSLRVVADHVLHLVSHVVAGFDRKHQATDAGAGASCVAGVLRC